MREASLQARARDNHLYVYEHFDCLLRYGQYFLSKEEMARSIRQRTAHFYEYLGARVYDRTDKEFWQIHRGWLARLGIPLSNVRLGVHAVSSGMEKAAGRLRRIGR